MSSNVVFRLSWGRQFFLPGCISDLLQTGVILLIGSKSDVKLYRAMVRAEHFRVDCRILQGIFQYF